MRLIIVIKFIFICICILYQDSHNNLYQIQTWHTAFTNSNAGFFKGKWDPASTGNSRPASLPRPPDKLRLIFCVILKEKIKKDVLSL